MDSLTNILKGIIYKMNQKLFKLNTISQLYDLVKVANNCKNKVLLRQDSFIVDARSILGILSLDLFKEVLFEFSDGDKESLDNFFSSYYGEY